MVLCEKVEIQKSSLWPKTHVWHGSGTDSTTTNQLFLFQMYCGNKHTLTLTVTKSGVKDHLLKHPWQEERGAHIWTALSAQCKPEKNLPNRDCTALIHAQEMLSTDRFSAVTISRKRQCTILGHRWRRRMKKNLPKRLHSFKSCSEEEERFRTGIWLCGVQVHQPVRHFHAFLHWRAPCPAVQAWPLLPGPCPVHSSWLIAPEKSTILWAKQHLYNEN